jgi:hypothetical protein
MRQALRCNAKQPRFGGELARADRAARRQAAASFRRSDAAMPNLQKTRGSSCRSHARKPDKVAIAVTFVLYIAANRYGDAAMAVHSIDAGRRELGV